MGDFYRYLIFSLLEFFNYQDKEIRGTLAKKALVTMKIRIIVIRSNKCLKYFRFFFHKRVAIYQIEVQSVEIELLRIDADDAIFRSKVVIEFCSFVCCITHLDFCSFVNKLCNFINVSISLVMLNITNSFSWNTMK